MEMIMVFLMIMTMIIKMRMRKITNIDKPTFFIHQLDDNENDDETNTNIVVQVYPEQLLGKIAKKAFATLGCSADEFFEVRKQQMKYFR